MLNVDRTAPPLYQAPKPVKRRGRGEDAPRIIMHNIDHISIFAYNNAAIDLDGNLWTWGCDVMVEREDGTISYDYPPLSLSAPRKRMEHVVAVSAGGESTYCVTEDGLLWGWGTNRNGKLGLGDQAPRPEPTIVLDGVKSVFASMDTTLCIREDDSLWGWGWSLNGCPIPSGQKTVLKPVHIMDDMLQANCNDDTVLAIKKDGTLWGWGINITDDRIIAPVPLMEDMAWVSMPSHGCGYAFAVSCSGDLYSFGISTYGSITPWQKRKDASLPIKVLSGVDKVFAGHMVTLIRLKDGDLLVSGNNGDDQFGIGGFELFHKPKFVMPNIKEAAVGWYHAMALQENGDLWLFGDPQPEPQQ